MPGIKAAEQGRLAAAVGADDAEHLAGPDDQVHAAQNRPARRREMQRRRRQAGRGARGHVAGLHETRNSPGSGLGGSGADPWIVPM